MEKKIPSNKQIHGIPLSTYLWFHSLIYLIDPLYDLIIRLFLFKNILQLN